MRTGDGDAQQTRTLVKSDQPPLQPDPWPAAPTFERYPEGWESFVVLSPEDQRRRLEGLRAQPERHGEILHRYLATVSSYLFGYEDSPLFRRSDDEVELQILQAKLVLEHELLEHWLAPNPIPVGLDQHQAATHLEALKASNPSLDHDLFEYIARDANVAAMRHFLWNEAIRNEVVDDEVAMMLAGLQGMMKATVASNLWDECGRGQLRNFHTYWLRRMLSGLGGWEQVVGYRQGRRPWFNGITTNVFNIFLTRPGLRLMAYGWFLINESWVAPHFDRILCGLRRVGLDDDDIQVYFDTHRIIDPRHTAELTKALDQQLPALAPIEVEHVVLGAHCAVAANQKQYDQMIGYLQSFSA